MNVHRHTPTLSVIEPRSLAIRSVGYCRHPDKLAIEPRITRQVFDAAGRLHESWDPRLWGAVPKANLCTVHGLNGQPLLTDSVDAGWQLSLLDHAGLPCSFWDARGCQRHTDHDNQQRPIRVTEQVAAEPPRVVERLTYGGSTEIFIQHNQCGRLIRHDDPAGSQCCVDYGLAGSALVEERRFLTYLETPDWPDEPDSREAWLEDQSFFTRHVFHPTGDIQRQTDAMGNVRTFGYDLAGKLSETWLLLAGPAKQPQRLVSDIQYNAYGQSESETAGNGVVTRADYSADDGRLIRLMAQVGDQKPLQDLNYRYDPVGNIVIVELEDKSQAVTYFNNQRIDPINRYRYDSLYQLVEARGWEVSTPSHGPSLPALLPTPLDPNQRRNYTQHFDYDPAGNLISRHHSGAPGFSMFTSAHSNRSLAQREDGSLPGEPDITSGFDACGNQLELQRGLAMRWDCRNQLSRVTLVKRLNDPDDFECYTYDRPGHRLRKVHFSQTSNQTLCAEVRYLPGLEIHSQADGEVHHVISAEAGRCSVRALHWPDGAHVDQLRYSLGDHLGSSTLELDDEAGVLTQEHYYPFGGTASWAGKSVLVAKYKTIRYSGKERDATGLYYYGYRYYAPWLQRWLVPDPAGSVNGIHLFCFVSNKPVNFKDLDGRFYEGENDETEQGLQQEGVIVARGLDQFQPEQSNIVRSELLETERIFADAQTAFRSNFAESSLIFQSYFGPEYGAVTGKIVKSWEKGERLSREYQGHWGSAKFIGFISSEDFIAGVDVADFYGRIAINVDQIKVGSLSLDLGHEILHLGRVNRFVAVGPTLLDNFYLSKNAKHTSGYNVNYYDLQQRRVSELIMQGKLTVEYLDQFDDEHSDFIFSVKQYLGRMRSVMDIDTAVSEFNKNPGLRAEMASENADSLIFAAKSMQELYKIRNSASQLFYGLLNS